MLILGLYPEKRLTVPVGNLRARYSQTTNQQVSLWTTLGNFPLPALDIVDSAGRRFTRFGTQFSIAQNDIAPP